jgi:hypothetical protein
MFDWRLSLGLSPSSSLIIISNLLINEIIISRQESVRSSGIDRISSFADFSRYSIAPRPYKKLTGVRGTGADAVPEGTSDIQKGGEGVSTTEVEKCLNLDIFRLSEPEHVHEQGADIVINCFELK